MSKYHNEVKASLENAKNVEVKKGFNPIYFRMTQDNLPGNIKSDREMTIYDKFRFSLTNSQILYLDSDPNAKEAEKVSLQLREDIYSYTYLRMIDTDDPILHRDLMLKSVLCFGLQMGLIYLIYYDPY